MQYSKPRKHSSMSGFPQPNKILKKLDAIKNQEILHQHLKNVKPRIDMSLPKSHDIFKGKTILHRAKGTYELLDENNITRQNKILLEKIEVIMNKPGDNTTMQIQEKTKSDKTRKKHLNETKYFEHHKLQEDNYKMSQRLHQTKSVFSIKKWEQDRLQHTRYKNLKQEYSQGKVHINCSANNDFSTNFVESNASQSWNMNSRNYNDCMQNTTIRDNGIYRKEQYYKLISKEGEEKIAYKPVIIQEEAFFADIKIDNGVFMMELTDLDNNKFYYHVQGKIGRKLYFVECSGNIDMFVKRIRIDKQNHSVTFYDNQRPLNNLKPIKPLKVSYTANLKNRPKLYINQHISDQSKDNQTEQNVASSLFPKTTKSIAQKFHNQKIPSRFEFVKGIGNQKENSHSRKSLDDDSMISNQRSSQNILSEKQEKQKNKQVSQQKQKINQKQKQQEEEENQYNEDDYENDDDFEDQDQQESKPSDDKQQKNQANDDVEEEYGQEDDEFENENKSPPQQNVQDNKTESNNNGNESDKLEEDYQDEDFEVDQDQKGNNNNNNDKTKSYESQKQTSNETKEKENAEVEYEEEYEENIEEEQAEQKQNKQNQENKKTEDQGYNTDEFDVEEE